MAAGIHAAGALKYFGGPSGRRDAQISIADFSAFLLDLEEGPRPCGKGSPVLAAGEICSVAVRFRPFASGVINGTLKVVTGDGSSPTTKA